MVDLSQLSEEELDRLESGLSSQAATAPVFDEGPFQQEDDSVLESIYKGVRDLPSTITQIPTGLYRLAEDYAAAKAFAPSIARDTLLGTQETPPEVMRAADRTGRAMFNLGGSALGTAAGAVYGGGYGALPGGVTGGVLGDAIYDVLTTGEIPTRQSLLNRMAYDTTQDVATLGLTKGVSRGARLARDLTTEGRKFLRTGTEAGQTAMAGDAYRKILREAGLTPDDIAELPESSRRSLAEQFDNERLARAEGALDRGYPESAGVEAQARRAARADANLTMAEEALTSDITSAEGVGARIFEELEEAAGESKKAVNKLYRDLDKTQILGGEDLVDSVEGAIDEFVSVKDPGKIDSSVTKIIEDIIDNDGQIDLDTANVYRQALGDVAFSQTASTTNKNLARTIRTAIDEAEDVAGGTLGRASDARARYGREFEQGATGNILRRRRYNERAMQNNQIPNKILANADNAKSFDAVATDGAREALSDYVLNDIREALGGRREGSRVNFWRKRDSALKTALTEEQYATVDELLSDVESQARFRELQTAPSRGSSPTAQFEADVSDMRTRLGADFDDFLTKYPVASGVGGAILGSIAGLLGGGIGGGAVVTALGMGAIQPYTRALLQAVEARRGRVATRVYNALTNRNAALTLLEEAQEGNQLARNALDMLDDVAAEVQMRTGASVEALLTPTATNVSSRLLADSDPGDMLSQMTPEELDALEKQLGG